MKYFVSLLLFVLLVACGGNSPAPTAVTEPSTSVEITETAVSTPTEKEEPTTEPAENRETVPAGRYSFQPVAEYEWEVQDGQMFMADHEGITMISVVGVPINKYTPEEVMDDFISGMESAGSGLFERGESSIVTVDNIDGTAVSLNGNLFGSPSEGKAVLVQPTDDWVIFAMAVSNVSENSSQWEDTGQSLLTTLLNSIQFLEETAVSEPKDGFCPVATDDSYGYTKANPIQIGGGTTDGPSRGETYLNNLIDPVGIPVSYERLDSLPYEDIVLDVYSITSPMVDKSVELYIDTHTYSELMAPVGFNCTAAFPISAP